MQARDASVPGLIRQQALAVRSREQVARSVLVVEERGAASRLAAHLRTRRYGRDRLDRRAKPQRILVEAAVEPALQVAVQELALAGLPVVFEPMAQLLASVRSEGRSGDSGAFHDEIKGR